MTEVKEKSSLWGDPIAKVFIPGVPQIIPSKLTEEEFNALLLRVRIEEITYKLTSGYPLNLDYPEGSDRSPSPPPIYDQFGKRTNTREQRRKEKLMKERQDLIQRVQKNYPVFKPPADYKPMSVKKSKKIYIPNNKYPEYNFIGLIIGPRGITQKQMEKESGAKIAIRGKGSFKDGKGRMDGKMNVGDDEDLHVLITADNDESIAKAEIMVNKLLVPVEEGKNEHKREQLRKLAEINGTLRDNTWKIDGTGMPFDGISCNVCGEQSHPTRDCPMKHLSSSKIDTEYQNFLATLGDNKNPEELHATEENREAYEELLSIINKVPTNNTNNNNTPFFHMVPPPPMEWNAHQYM